MTTYIIITVIVLLLAYTITRGLQNDDRDRIIDTSKHWAESNWSLLLNELSVKPKNKLANRLWEYSVADKQFDITHVIARAKLVQTLNDIEDLDVLLEQKVVIINENGEFVLSNAQQKEVAEINAGTGNIVANSLIDLLNSINKSKNDPFNQSYQYFKQDNIKLIVKHFKQKTKGAAQTCLYLPFQDYSSWH